MIKEFEKIEIVNAILSNKKDLPSFLNIHPALDKKIHNILSGNKEPIDKFNRKYPQLKSPLTHITGYDSLTIDKEEIDNNEGSAGFEIKIPGFNGNPDSPEEGQIFIEYYEGKIKVHVWNGESDPITTEIEKDEE